MVAVTFSDTDYETHTASTGLITSPNYPNPYPKNTFYGYSILAPSSATIKLQFLDFSVFAVDFGDYFWGGYLYVCVMFVIFVVMYATLHKTEGVKAWWRNM